MSCFVVPDFHIDTLVSWAVANGAAAFIDGLTPRELAAELHLANCAAYRERYGEDAGENYTFTMRPEVHAMPAVQVLKACSCFDYQACSWSKYDGSPAQRAVERIRDHAITYVPGYRAAFWTLETWSFEGVTA
jgi:hypothetical protein